MEIAVCPDFHTPPGLLATELLPVECWSHVLGFLFPASSKELAAAMPLPEARATCKTFLAAVDDLELKRLREEVDASTKWYFGSSKWRRLLSAILRKTSVDKTEFTSVFLGRVIELTHRRGGSSGDWIFRDELLWVVRLLATRGHHAFLLNCTQGSTISERFRDLRKQLHAIRLPPLVARGEFARKALRFVVPDTEKVAGVFVSEVHLSTAFSFSPEDLEALTTAEFLLEDEDGFKARLSSATRCLILASDPRPFEGLWRQFGDRFTDDEISNLFRGALSKLPFNTAHANRQSRLVSSLDVVVRTVGAERLNRAAIWDDFVQGTLRAGSVVFLRWFSELYRPLGPPPVVFPARSQARVWILRYCKSVLWSCSSDIRWLLEPTLSAILDSCDFSWKDGTYLFATAATAGNPEWASRICVCLWRELCSEGKVRRFDVDSFEKAVLCDEVRLEPERCLALLAEKPSRELCLATANLFACYARIRSEDRPKLFQASAARRLVESLDESDVRGAHWLAVASESRDRAELEAALGKWEAHFHRENPPEKPAFKRRRRLIRDLTALAATFFYSEHPEHVELFASLRNVVEESHREGALLAGLLSKEDPESLGPSDMLEEIEFGLFASIDNPPSDPHPDNVARLQGSTFLRGARHRIKNPDLDHEDDEDAESWIDVLSRSASYDLLDRVVDRLDPRAVAQTMRDKTVEPQSLAKCIVRGAPPSLLKKTVRIACTEAVRSIEATPGAEETPASLALRRRDAAIEALLDAFVRPFVREIRGVHTPEHALLKLRWFEKMLRASPRRLGRMLRLPVVFDADDWGASGHSRLWEPVLEGNAHLVEKVSWARMRVVRLQTDAGEFEEVHPLLLDSPFYKTDSVGIDPDDSPRAFAHPRCYRWLRKEHLESTRNIAASLSEPHASYFLKSFDRYSPIIAGDLRKRARDEAGTVDENRPSSSSRRRKTA